MVCLCHLPWNKYCHIYVYLNYQKAAKWSERKEAVAELTKLASTKKIAPGDFSEVCRTLKKVCYGFP